MSKSEVLAVAKLPPFYQKALESVYTVHDRTHMTDPAAFAALASRIVGVAGTGEASVPRSLLSQLPNAKVVAGMVAGHRGRVEDLIEEVRVKELKPRTRKAIAEFTYRDNYGAAYK